MKSGHRFIWTPVELRIKHRHGRRSSRRCHIAAIWSRVTFDVLVARGHARLMGRPAVAGTI
jgi:hypothetical protein